MTILPLLYGNIVGFRPFQTPAHTDILLMEILPTVSTIRVLYIPGGAGILPLDGLSLENQLRKVALSNWEAFLHLFKRLLLCSLSWRNSLLWFFELCQKIRFSTTTTTPGLVPTRKSPVCTITSHMEKLIPPPHTKKRDPYTYRCKKQWRLKVSHAAIPWVKETESYPFRQSSWSPGIDKKVCSRAGTQVMKQHHHPEWLACCTYFPVITFSERHLN